ncbi:ABC transporter ATP-binding protein [Homoserinibacter sp. YIM 151385]|uniref:ABC transporter ATP-binding protein n=1 Tax=Homoserinibacter sp. YIM 151385 TaxID=2985506 RepID=UPI0022EFE6C4|nr:ABC transporter ATP-binding protein [Homoserinibacter sp. YIM 151385]WBU37096.1 ABC transporter ATP-binding protein [Homoserinibacter sp. YIM 151385]
MTTTTETSALVQTRGITKTFGSGDREMVALSGLDLEVRKGEFLSLLGPSGCGKSTALNIMGGLLAPTSGDITFDGQPMTEPRRDIGMMFQQAVMFPWRTTLQNVLLPVEIAGESKKAHAPKARELLGMVGIGEFADSYPWQLSGGMQQRAALCRVLLDDPKLLLLDEPFGALDEFTRETMNQELLRLQAYSGSTAVLVTHNITEAVFMSDRIAVMSARPGRLVDIIEVPFDRPRTPDLQTTSDFVALVAKARRMLELQ